jgi:hypothetical protein
VTKPSPKDFIEAARECLDRPRDLRDTIDDPPLYFDRQGKPMSLKAWVDAWGRPEYRLVAEALIDGTRVITMWMGTDQSFSQSPKPLIFGSATFRDGKMQAELESSTEKEALVHHAVLCAIAKLEAHQRS